MSEPEKCPECGRPLPLGKPFTIEEVRKILAGPNIWTEILDGYEIAYSPTMSERCAEEVLGARGRAEKAEADAKIANEERVARTREAIIYRRRAWEAERRGESLDAEIVLLRAERDAILQEARVWAGEAKAQRRTVNEVGSALGGIPDWGPTVKAVRAKLEALTKAEADLAMSDGCLLMIRETLESLGCCHGHDGTHTPPMMYPEWIRCVVKHHAKRLREALEEIRLGYWGYPVQKLTARKMANIAKQILKEASQQEGEAEQ